MSKYHIKYTEHEYDEENDVDSYHEAEDVVTADGIYGLLALAESYGQIVHTIVRIDDPELDTDCIDLISQLKACC